MRSASTPTAESSVRRWLASATASAGRVADEPGLWLAGGLAWLTTVGWIPFVAAVARPPSVAELTYLVTGLWTSGLWPLNVILLAAGAVAAVVLALALAAAGNAVLVAAQGRRASARDVGSILVVSLLGAVPVALCALTIAVATAAVGPAEFNRPGLDASPVLRTLARIAPLLVLGAVVTVAASTLSGLAGRAAMRGGSVASGLGGVRTLVGLAGRAGPWHLAASVAVAIGYLLLSGLLLSVLWAPIRAGLESGSPLDFASGLLLVGFVAIWLCLVLAGGALHAWASMTATVLLGGGTTKDMDERPQEMLLDR